MTLFGQEHVDAYLATDGEEGHDWRGTQTLILTTTGRRSGKQRLTPLIYGRHGDDYLLVASNGGTPQSPDWYFNLADEPRGRHPGQGREAARPRAHGDAGGEARAVADHDEGMARLRRVPDEDRPRHPGRGARARLTPGVRAQAVACSLSAAPASIASSISYFGTSGFG